MMNVSNNEEILSQGITVSKLTKHYGSQLLFEDISFTVEQGEFMVIVGPSGCGKSSLMRVIAGIEEHGPGNIFVDGVNVTDRHPGDRQLSMVFQDYALYPHMTVENNWSFGLRARGMSKADIKERVEATAKVVSLEDQLHKKPGELSGGQRQRVALGRAMIQEPRAFLMDEPLSNLDAALRVQMRSELLDFHRRVKGTVLYVTHDQVEAMTMGDRVAVMNKGRFEQVGTPDEVYSSPVNQYVAGFLGSPKMNFFTTTVESDADGLYVDALGAKLSVDPGHSTLQVGQGVVLGLRPEAIELTSENDSEGVSLAVDYIENLGNERLLHLNANNGQRVSMRTSEYLKPDTKRVTTRFALQRAHIFDDTGLALWHGPETSLANSR